jgi:hypothetical protein
MKLAALLLLLVFSSACSVASGEIPVPADTLPPATPTPESSATPTIIWFPPTATFTPYPTPMITPTPNLLEGIGEILLEDEFSTADMWSLTSTTEGGVALSKNELTIAIKGSKAYFFSVRQEPILTDFYAEITANPNLCKGADEYGLLLRVSETGDYYRFSLSCDSQVRLDRVIGSTASSPQPWLLSGDVPPGAPSISRLSVRAEGSEMLFFVNGQHQFTVVDPMLASGRIGIFARSTGANAVTINFSNLVIRTLED